jgi:hypothetical protein
MTILIFIVLVILSADKKRRQEPETWSAAFECGACSFKGCFAV